MPPEVLQPKLKKKGVGYGRGKARHRGISKQKGGREEPRGAKHKTRLEVAIESRTQQQS